MCLSFNRRSIRTVVLGISGLATVFLLTQAVCAAGTPAPDDAIGSTKAVTLPNYDAELSLAANGLVSKIHVKAGQSVKQGQLLVSLDDRVLQARLAALKASKDNTIRIRAAKAQLAQKKLNLERVEALHKKKVATIQELELAKLDVVLEELSIELARFEQDQAKLQYDEVLAQIQMMRILAPRAGVVEEVFVEEGKTVELAEKVLRLVSTDPLWADVPVVTSRAATIKVGQPVQIQDEEDPTWFSGKVLHIASVADSASRTRMVRVTMKNPNARPAGSMVRVRFDFKTPARSTGAAKKGQ